MDFTFDDIRPFLSERGQLEVELAAYRCQIATLTAAQEGDAGDAPTNQ